MMKIITAFALSSFVATSAFAAAGGTTATKHRNTRMAQKVVSDKAEAKPAADVKPEVKPTESKPAEAKPVEGAKTTKRVKKNHTKPATKDAAPAPAAEAPATK